MSGAKSPGRDDETASNADTRFVTRGRWDVLALRTTLSARERFRLAWGKARRFYLAHFRPGYVRRSLARRVGDCNRTGACCHLMFTCPLLDSRSNPVRCSIQAVKPRVCRLFPIDERDLRDRDIIAPDTPCGFSFIPLRELEARRAEQKAGHDASVTSR